MSVVESSLLLRRDASVAFLQRRFEQLIHDVDQVNGDAAWACTLAENIATGGKHVRSLLVHVGADRPAHVEATPDIAFGAAFDLLHAAFLVLDDVIDADEQRRGSPTIHAAARQRATDLHGPITRDDAAHYGTSVAILAGTAAMNEASRIIIDAGAPADTTVQLMRIFHTAITDSVVGEFMDIHHSLPGVDASDDLVRMASRLKTSSYSFETPLISGAILAGRDWAVPHLTNLGRTIGSAYQLADDIQSIFAPSSITGKDPAGDLIRGRATPLMALAQHTQQWPDMVAAIAGGDLDHARTLLRHSGAVDKAHAEAEGYLDDAAAILNTEGLFSPEARTALTNVGTYIRRSLDVAR